MKIAVVGVTGLVGRKITAVLQERNLPVSTFIAAASAKSIEKKITFHQTDYPVVSIEEAVKQKPDIAIFSAGSEVSMQWAPLFSNQGTYVIDNSSAWRGRAEIPLVVPEINGNSITKENYLIANPNCSTIQLVMVLAPLHNVFSIKRVVIATYQSVTGSGAKGLQQLEAEQQGKADLTVYPHPIAMNVLPHAGNFEKNGSTSEEIKLMNETRKILNNNKIGISATAVRVPVKGGHSEAVNLAFKKSFSLTQVKKLLNDMPGVTVMDNPKENRYPMPLLAEGSDAVFVGRIRRDPSIENGLNLWIVADNLRKGAATNAVQIAQLLINKGFIKKN